MRKYTEYSDSELREKFPEVDDTKYDRYEYECDLIIGVKLFHTDTDEPITTHSDLDEVNLMSSKIKKPGLDENGWRKDDN